MDVLECGVRFTKEEWEAVVAAAVLAYDDEDDPLALILDRLARKMDAAMYSKQTGGEMRSWREMPGNLPGEFYQSLAREHRAVEMVKAMRGRFR